MQLWNELIRRTSILKRDIIIITIYEIEIYRSRLPATQSGKHFDIVLAQNLQVILCVLMKN